MPGINLFDMLTQASNGGAVQQISQQTGLQPDQTQLAIKALLPAIAGGLQRNANQPGGLQDLLGALQGGHHEQYLDQPETLGRPETIADGNAILGHLLGSKDTSRAVAQAASKKTGLDSGILKMLLPVVASMAMGSLSKQTKQPNIMDALGGILGGGQPQPTQAQASGGMGGMLGNVLGGMLGGGAKRQQPKSGALGMLGGLLDADGDGNAMDDIFEMVMKRR
ncbi:MAG: DUF937 domain-containing protein [Hyphomonas sp.]